MTAPSFAHSDQILDRTRAVLREQLGDAMIDVPDDAVLPQVLGSRYDSLAALECVTRVEDAFDIEVDFVSQDVRYWFATVERIAQFARDQMEDRAVIGGRS